ncbi:MAG: hypothetical protein JNN15_16585 [Blastocatellia bacterium]|nr:hypothetical protein [Blastocatellia bacterium]
MTFSLIGANLSADFSPTALFSLKFNYRMIHLNRFNGKDYLKIDNRLAAAMMMKIGIATEDRGRVKIEEDNTWTQA